MRQRVIDRVLHRLTVCLLSLLLTGAVWAEFPDPLVFGYAVERGDIARVTHWLDDGLDPDYEAARVGTGLMVAAWNGNIDMMALFVERGANVQRSNRNGEQALQLAAWGGHLEAVKWLLAHGAPLDRLGNEWGALHYAAFNGHEPVARELITRGANINARTPNRSTPLMLAAREGRDNLARLLLEAGADTKAQSDWGDSALTMAMRYDHLRLAKMISSPEDFAIAVKASPETFGTASRSAPASPEIEAILNEIRAAEAEGRPSEELHKKLLAAVNALRNSAARTTIGTTGTTKQRPPRALVITARRLQPGAERVQLVADERGRGSNTQAAAKKDRADAVAKKIQ